MLRFTIKEVCPETVLFVDGQASAALRNREYAAFFLRRDFLDL
jgi:hypothetical protein